MQSHLAKAKRVQIERTRLRLEPLELRALLSTMVLESEPNNTKPTADEVSFDAADGGADVIGAIGSRQDQDFFHFRAASAGSIDLASDTAGGFNTKITVEDGRGVKLLETEPNNGINSGSFSVAAGQDVFIRVRGNRNATGDYTVHLTLNDPGTALAAHVVGDLANAIGESEPNDRKEQANAVDLGTDRLAQLQGVSAGQRDKDFFRFTASASGTLNVGVESTAGPTAKLQVEDAAGNKMIETEPNNGINAGSFQVTAGTTYFIRLRSPNNAPAAYLVDLALM
jgi:hypothetical protein